MKAAHTSSSRQYLGVACLTLMPMTLTSMQSVTPAAGGAVIRPYPTAYRTAQIDGVSIFYREAGPKDAPTNIDADELSVIFHDFCSGFGERAQDEGPLIKRPKVIDTTAAHA